MLTRMSFPLAILALTFITSPEATVEGWWRPEGPDPHPTALPAAIRNRVSAATVDLGRGRSGVFISRDGLVLTSATALRSCIEALQQEGKVSTTPFYAPTPDVAPVCPGLTARISIDVRDVTDAVNAAERAGSSQVQQSLVTACNHAAPQRRCTLVTTEDGIHRLIVHREIRTVRLRYWPGENLSTLGGVNHGFDRPLLRIDAAIVSVAVGHAGAPGQLRLSPRAPRPHDPLWVFHHPARSLRWASATEAEVFVDKVLPAFLTRARTSSLSRERVALELLNKAAPDLIVRARKRTLKVLSHLRSKATSPELLEAYTHHREAFQSLPWTQWAKAAHERNQCPPLLGHLVAVFPPVLPQANSPTTAEPPCSTSDYQAASRKRRQAHLMTNSAPLGPDGRNDLRISRAEVMLAQSEEKGRITWARLLEVAKQLKHPLELPTPLPWRKTYAIAFELASDIGPLVTGGPVVDAQGELQGIISSGDKATLAGLLQYEPQSRVSMTSVHALVVLMRRSPARPFVRHLQPWK